MSPKLCCFVMSYPKKNSVSHLPKKDDKEKNCKPVLFYMLYIKFTNHIYIYIYGLGAFSGPLGTSCFLLKTHRHESVYA